ncbi:hypothetical protein AYO21_06535 [Fonsecaea monophora]|uniref:Xylanolytic transcriptional activator regulatory domain-containing protein n=1 Tax=Fonsecaea monophora TaxID=254056 RepID=A0A177F6N4_9EURO|nr:hypothetical protein AYO21_06535 [Fonsecaea monophora]OAG39331.1 hypothetical protein AYO21_06535 [Fonsecaea monophora]
MLNLPLGSPDGSQCLPSLSMWNEAPFCVVNKPISTVQDRIADQEHGEASSHSIAPPHDLGPAVVDPIVDSVEGSSHVVSPAIADDDNVFQMYLFSTPYGQRGRTVRFYPNAGDAGGGGPVRVIVFNTAPRRGRREKEGRALAASKCAMIERHIAPYEEEVINLFFDKINKCFPIFDEILFRRLLLTQKDKISPSLLAFLYGITLIYWNTSPSLKNVPRPDPWPLWRLAEDTLNEEFKCTPGISTIMSILINLSTRPSLLNLGNSALMGMAVSLANAFGLNRDPSGWNLSLTEKKFRIRIWRIVLICDRWCSLAYGTPPLINRVHHDVPIPAVEDLYNPGASADQISATRRFVALATLTDVLGDCLELVYRLEMDPSKRDATPHGLESLLTHWEDSLTDNLRREVLRGKHLVGPGAANLRLAYLSVKLLIRRRQLDLDKTSRQIGDVDSLCFLQARKAAEEVVDFVRELEESHCRDFWIPFNAHTLTSATTFLLRSALSSRGPVRNTSLQLARRMIEALDSHRRNYAWDLADNCLANCTDLMDKIEAACAEPTCSTAALQESMPMDMDIEALEDWFPDFPNSYPLDPMG